MMSPCCVAVRSIHERGIEIPVLVLHFCVYTYWWGPAIAESFCV